MAFYFRSSEANDLCYSAQIQREVCRPIQITTKRPAPLAPSTARLDLPVHPAADTRIGAYPVDVVSEDHHAGS
jgi:hypothetical protein